MKHEKKKGGNAGEFDLGAVHQVNGGSDASGKRFAIVVGRFNESLTRELVTQAVGCLRESGAADDAIDVIWVPGAYEIPAVIEVLASKGQHDALIALGVVIEGETRHAELVSRHVAETLGRVGMLHALPVIYEVISAYNMDQAVRRCEGERDSAGWYAAEAAIEMIDVFKEVQS